jgi:hypothetical protein
MIFQAKTQQTINYGQSGLPGTNRQLCLEIPKELGSMRPDIRDFLSKANGKPCLWTRGF